MLCPNMRGDSFLVMAVYLPHDFCSGFQTTQGNMDSSLKQPVTLTSDVVM